MHSLGSLSLGSKRSHYSFAHKSNCNKLHQATNRNATNCNVTNRNRNEPPYFNHQLYLHILAFIPHPFPPFFPQTYIFSFVFEIPNALSFLVTVASLDKIEMKNNLKKIQARPIKAATACRFDQSSTCKIAPSTPMPLLVLYLHTT